MKLPTPPNDVEEAGSEKAAKGGALKKPYFKLGVVAEFFYVGIQTVGFSLFATYATKVAGLEMSLATGLVSACRCCSPSAASALRRFWPRRTRASCSAST